MFPFLIQKIVFFCVSLFLIATITFFLMHAVPGDPFTQDRAIPDEILLSLQKHYGLDRPLFYQYLSYLQGLFHGDLGPSFRYIDRSVTQIIKESFPISLHLGFQALILSIGCGIFLGSLTAHFQGLWQDKVFMIAAILGLSIPSFLIATFLQYFFAIKWDLLPVARWGSFAQTILPTCSLAALPTVFIARQLRATTIEILHQDYIQTAKSKGLSLFKILTKHVFRNACMPILSYLGPLTASILTGSFAIEKIFSIPGLGQWFVNSISNRDYTVIMGTTLFYGSLLIFMSFIVDLISCTIDPRIRVRKKFN